MEGTAPNTAQLYKGVEKSINIKAKNKENAARSKLTQPEKYIKET